MNNEELKNEFESLIKHELKKAAKDSKYDLYCKKNQKKIDFFYSNLINILDNFNNFLKGLYNISLAEYDDGQHYYEALCVNKSFALGSKYINYIYLSNSFSNEPLKTHMSLSIRTRHADLDLNFDAYNSTQLNLVFECSGVPKTDSFIEFNTIIKNYLQEKIHSIYQQDPSNFYKKIEELKIVNSIISTLRTNQLDLNDYIEYNKEYTLTNILDIFKSDKIKENLDILNLSTDSDINLKIKNILDDVEKCKKLEEYKKQYLINKFLK